jgi:probable blue pigment (indigoidine) exporter
MTVVLHGYRHAFFLTGAAAAWGVATAISKRAVDEIPPLTLLPVQLAVSVALLLLVARQQRQQVRWSPQLRRLAALGVLNPGVSYALSLLGLVHLSASLSVLLWAVEPVLILLLAWWLLHERMTRRAALAMTCAVGGVLLVVAQGGAAGSALGVALTLAGVGACAAYTVICRRLLADDAALPVVLVQQACALIFAVAVFAAAYLAGWSPALGHVSGWAWMSAVVAGALYYAIAFWLYLTGLREVPASVAGIYLTLIPAFGITSGYLLLSEHLTARQWLGAGVVIAAVAALTLLDGRPARHPRGSAAGQSAAPY